MINVTINKSDVESYDWLQNYLKHRDFHRIILGRALIFIRNIDKDSNTFLLIEAVQFVLQVFINSQKLLVN